MKTNHITSVIEILKPNGEKIFVDLKKDVMISENLVEEKEQKNYQSNSDAKKELIEKNRAVKHQEEKNKLIALFVAKTSLNLHNKKSLLLTKKITMRIHKMKIKILS